MLEQLKIISEQNKFVPVCWTNLGKNIKSGVGDKSAGSAAPKVTRLGQPSILKIYWLRPVSVGVLPIL